MNGGMEAERTWHLGLVVEFLPSMCEALSLSLSTEGRGMHQGSVTNICGPRPDVFRVAAFL